MLIHLIVVVYVIGNKEQNVEKLDQNKCNRSKRQIDIMYFYPVFPVIFHIKSESFGVIDRVVLLTVFLDNLDHIVI